MGASARPQAPTDDRGRVVANVQRMRAQGASDAEVEHYLGRVEGLAPPAADPAPVSGAPAAASPPARRTGAVEAFLGGASWGAADEAGARLEAAAEQLPYAWMRRGFGVEDRPAGGPKRGYAEALRARQAGIREGMQQYATNSPEAAAAAEVAGALTSGIITGGGAGALLARGARAVVGAGAARATAPGLVRRVAGRVVSGAAEAAVDGALGGAGNANGDAHARLGGAAAGAKVAGLLGGGMAGAVPALASAARGARNVVTGGTKRGA